MAMALDLMRLRHLNYEGPEISSGRALRRMPGPLRDLLRRINGFVAFDGGFHLRGVCLDPGWHSIQAVMSGPGAFHQLFDNVSPQDVPFAQDALGDQFLLRGYRIHLLHAETGDVEDLEMDLDQFMDAVVEDPLSTLDMAPLHIFMEEGGRLTPGELLEVEPPLCLRQPGQPTSFKALACAERMENLSLLARRMSLVPDVGLFDMLNK